MTARPEGPTPPEAVPAAGSPAGPRTGGCGTIDLHGAGGTAGARISRTAGPITPPGVAGDLERERLAVLHQFGVLDTAPEQAFEDLAGLAAQVCGTPMALVSLVDADRQWFKARLGVELCQTSRESSFCAHALDRHDVLLVPDTHLDARFLGNELVTGPPHVRFYAGAPLITSTGHVLGTLCVLDTVARTLTAQQRGALTALARQVVSQLELRRQTETLAAEVAGRAAAQRGLAASQRLLDGVLNHTDVVVYAKDLDGRFLMANPALHQLLDQPDGQVLGRSDYDLFPQLAADVFRRNDIEIAVSGVRQNFTEELPHPDGTVHSYLSTKFPLRDETGAVYAVAGVSSDVTELTGERAAHAQAQDRWRALVECSPVAVAVIGADGRFAYANPRARELYGTGTDSGVTGDHGMDTQASDGPDQLIGRSARDFVPTGEREASATMFRALVHGGPPVLGRRWTLRRLDGLLVNVEINAARVSYAGETAVQVELRDVTAQATIEAQLRASEARFRALFMHAPVGMAESLPDGTLVAVNPHLCQLLGYQAEELIGRPASALLADPADDARQRADLGKLAITSEYVTERRYRRSDGAALSVLVGVAAVHDESGQISRVLGSIIDVTDRVRAQAELRAAHAELQARQAFTDALLDSVDVGIVACDADGHLTTFNRAAQLWHGLSPGTDADPSLLPADLARHYDLYSADGTTALTPDQIPLLAALRDGTVREQEIVIAPKRRPATRVLCSGQVLRDPAGRRQGAVVAMHDITELRKRDQELRDSVAFHDAVLVSSPDLIFVSDLVTETISWSSRHPLDILGYTPDQVRALGTDPIGQKVHPDDRVRLHASNIAARDLGDGEVHQLRYRILDSAGRYRWVSQRATAFRRDPGGQVRQVLAVATDITEIVEVEQRLSEAALHDPLTGLPNRTLLADRLGLALRRSARTGNEVAIMFCDLDGFKHVNDTAGHAAGDEVLRATADRLRAVLRPQDTVARVGGDEFVIVLEPTRPVGGGSRVDAATGRPAATDLPAHVAAADRAMATYLQSDVLAVAARVNEALRQPVTYQGSEHVVTASIGITFARAGDDPEEVLRDADSAMYLAKARGRDRHELFATSDVPPQSNAAR